MSDKVEIAQYAFPGALAAQSRPLNSLEFATNNGESGGVAI